MKKCVRWMSIVSWLLSLCLVLTSCALPYDTETLRKILGNLQGSGEQTSGTTDSTPVSIPQQQENAPEDSWAIYWYLCGSDLESEGGAATADLQEMLKITLPENVQVVVQTGGAAVWQNDEVSANALGRYVYNSEGFTKVDEQPLANMGSKDTLADFLRFCSQNYPAEHTAVIFWNHGGDFSTVAFDEIYGYDSLTLYEMQQAFGEVYQLSAENPPFEMVGFDACFLGTVDAARVFAPIARYMVASEETEPGCGWNYTGWLGELAEDPEMNGDELGVVICDTYQQGCEAHNVGDEITLSVVDLQKISPLLNAYESLGQEALYQACQNTQFFSVFAQRAMGSDRYGNFDESGFMIDLGDLAENSSDLFSEKSSQLIQALNECVVYNVAGPLHEESSGLSCYYAYKAGSEYLQTYKQISASEAFEYFYTYQLTGQLGQDGLAYIHSLGFDVSSQITIQNLNDFPVTIGDDAYAYLELGPDIASTLQEVCFDLFYVDPTGNTIIELGRDNNLHADWSKGLFWDNFTGYWGALDGYYCYMILQYSGDGYNVYSVPILLNGELYSLRVAYLYDQNGYTILGARKILDGNMLDKNLIQLQPGDVVTTLSYVGTSDNDFYEQLTQWQTFTVTENTTFADKYMGDGRYMMCFEMVDISGNTYYSEFVTFDIKNGKIYVDK